MTGKALSWGIVFAVLASCTGDPKVEPTFVVDTPTGELPGGAAGEDPISRDPAPDVGVDPPGPPEVNPPQWEVTFSSNTFYVQAVAPDGTAYATQNGAGTSRLWMSTDHARTWAARGTHPRGGRVRQLTALSDGTLLADVEIGGDHFLSRSTDRAATWTDVLPLGSFRMLQPRNIVELGGTVFFGEYQSFASLSDIRLWASTDRGATWSVRHLFNGRRHAHGLVADPVRNELWILFGDWTGGIVLSNDLGHTWRSVKEEVVPVDAVVTPRGLLFGLDTVFKPDPTGVVLLRRDGTGSLVAPLPGPSYSILEPRAGGYLQGTTRETGGDVYAEGDFAAHLFASATGDDWTELFAFPRLSATEYAHSHARWELATGEVVIQLDNVQLMAPTGYGYLLLRRR